MFSSVFARLFRRVAAIDARKFVKPLLISGSVAFLSQEYINRASCFNDADNYHADHLAPKFCHLAANGNERALKTFIVNNQYFDINTKHPYGWNGLISAVLNRNLTAVSFLLKHGADPNDTDEFPGVHRLASRYHFGDILPIVLEREKLCSQFNIYQDFTGFTALHYAAFMGYKDAVEVLIANGADINIKNAQGLTPVDLALNEELKGFLRQKQSEKKAEESKKLIELRRKFPIEQEFEKVIVGQKDAIKSVAGAIRRRENGWSHDEHPIVFLFLGSSGVGKTELAKQLSNYLKNSSKSKKVGFIRLDMSEYQQKHEVSKIIGSPPGYIGHDEGGQLTKLLAENPYSIVLFDEIEKAHPDILTIMLQLFDEGRLTDGKGETIECKDAIFIMTSNLASETIGQHAASLRAENNKNNVSDENISISRQFKDEVIYPILKRHFKRDEFLGRITEIVYFLPFSKRELAKLAEIELKYWADKAKNNHQIVITWDSDVCEVIADGYNAHYGARSLKHETEHKIGNLLAEQYESGKISPRDRIKLRVNYGTEKKPLPKPEIEIIKI